MLTEHTIRPIKVEFHEKMRDALFGKYRYRVFWSGRGGLKSWSIARAILLRGASEKITVMCAREIQKSIADSVHRLLKEQIILLNLDPFYTVLESKILGLNGTEIFYVGLGTQTTESVKSYEGVDICWIEEGQAVKERSWMILIPTIRKHNSEIWISMNPQMDTDFTWLNFVEHPPPNSVVVEMNWRDGVANGWFSKELDQERRRAQATMSAEDYQNIWEGKPRSASEGAVYKHEMARIVAEQRICHIPYDPTLKVHTIWDFGWNNATAIVMAQIIRSECRIIGYLEGRERDLAWYLGILKTMPLNWGMDWIPHDGDHHTFLSPTTAHQLMRAFGRTVARPRGAKMGKYGIPSMPVLAGIQRCRLLLARCVFNNRPVHALDQETGLGYNGVGRLIECLRRYEWKVPVNASEAVGPKPGQEWSHGADAMRMLAMTVDQMENIDVPGTRPVKKPRVPAFRPRNAAMGLLG